MAAVPPAAGAAPVPAAAHDPGQPGARPPAARLIEVSKYYGDNPHTRVVALDRVTFHVPAGEFTAVMGPSGSGKSTLMHCLAGLDQPSSGHVVLGERDITQLGDQELTILRRREIGFIFQAFNLIPTLTARENVLLPFELDGKKPTAEQEQWIAQLLDRLDLTQRAGHLPSELSGGQQQRVAIARALATRPRLVIADEPTGNLDSRSGAEVLRILREASSRAGQTIVMVTHDPAAAAAADSILFLADGRIRGHERGMNAEAVSRIMLAGHDTGSGAVR